MNDDLSALRALNTELSDAGYEVRVAATAEQAMTSAVPVPDVVLLARDLAEGDAFEILDRFASLDPRPATVMMTRHGDIPSVVEAMRAGAWDCLTEPVSTEAVSKAVAQALENRRILADGADTEHPALAAIIGESPALRRAKLLLQRIASSPASTVLITGESGTGKDLAAKAIHTCSGRAEGLFVNINCSALPSELLESELFGHERGAFTDAKSSKLGLVERANGGTLFLDEIGEMEPRLQAKLLRFLEDKTFRRVGGSTELRADVRVIAATNVDLPAAVAARRFRADLYYRLAVLTVQLPPLRERPGDVPLLVHHFLSLFAAQFDKPLAEPSPRAMQLLQRHPWPGNVRELKNTVERAALLARGGVLHGADFELTPSADSSPPRPVSLPPSGVDLKQLEITLVRQALSRCRGNVTRAGRLLGLNRDQVRYRVAKYGLEEEVSIQRSAG